MTEYHDRIRKVAEKLNEIDSLAKDPHYLHTDLYTYTDGTLNFRIDGNLDHHNILRLCSVLCYLRKVLKDEPPTTSISHISNQSPKD